MNTNCVQVFLLSGTAAATAAATTAAPSAATAAVTAGAYVILAEFAALRRAVWGPPRKTRRPACADVFCRHPLRCTYTPVGKKFSCSCVVLFFAFYCLWICTMRMPFFPPSYLNHRPRRLSVLTAATANEWSLDKEMPFTEPPAPMHAPSTGRREPPPPFSARNGKHEH